MCAGYVQQANAGEQEQEAVPSRWAGVLISGRGQWRPRPHRAAARIRSSLSLASGVKAGPKSSASKTCQISISDSVPGKGLGLRLTHSIASDGFRNRQVRYHGRKDERSRLEATAEWPPRKRKGALPPERYTHQQTDAILSYEAVNPALSGKCCGGWILESWPQRSPHWANAAAPEVFPLRQRAAPDPGPSGRGRRRAVALRRAGPIRRRRCDGNRASA